MYISLMAKNKLGFINGSCVKESYDPSLYQVWDRCDAVVFSWIMNSFSKKLMSGIVYSTSVFQVWSVLKEHFNKVNGSIIFQLQC